jgi:hypothetical protein
MGGKNSKAPAPPDPYQTASADAQFNRLNTYNPDGGGTRFGYTDASGKFVAGMAPPGQQSAVTTIESPFEKAIREMLQPASKQLVGRMITDNVTGMPDAARPKDTSGIAKSIFDRNFSLMSPALEKGQNRLLTNLQNRGLPVGGEAFNEAMGAQKRETDDMISRLAQDATINAGQEQSRQFGIDSAARSGSISEIVAAMGGGYSPATATTPNMQGGSNYASLVSQKYGADMANWQQQQQNRTGLLGTLGTLGGAALMKCSIQAKDVLHMLPVDVAADAVARMPLAVWRYKPELAPEGDMQIHAGPMAEHFQQLTGLGDGATIHQIDAFGVLFGALQSALQRIEVLERIIEGEEVH